MQLLRYILFRLWDGVSAEEATDCYSEMFEFNEGWPLTSDPFPPPEPAYTISLSEDFELLSGWSNP